MRYKLVCLPDYLVVGRYRFLRSASVAWREHKRFWPGEYAIQEIEA